MYFYYTALEFQLAFLSHKLDVINNNNLYNQGSLSCFTRFIFVHSSFLNISGVQVPISWNPEDFL